MTKRIKLVDTPSRPQPAPCITVDPDVARAALDLAEHDHRRLKIMADGSVLVRNRR